MINEHDWGPLARHLEWTYPLFFLILFILLSIAVFVLIGKLRSKNYSMSDESVVDHYFKKEICTLTTILILFSISYLLRVIYDIFIGFSETDGTFTSYMIGATTGIPFDLLPIVVVLLFHRHNLRQINLSRSV